MGLRQRIGHGLARFLSCDRPGLSDGPTSDITALIRAIRPGDVLLVEGTSRFSTAIKYLTQSTWSHAALCTRGGSRPRLVEADVSEGVRSISLDLYGGYHTRLCRPVSLSDHDLQAVIQYMERRVGNQYDLRHIIDLARYLFLPLRCRHAGGAVCSPWAAGSQRAPSARR